MRSGRAVGLWSFAAVAALMASACGRAPDFVTANGVQVFLETDAGALSPNQAERMERYLLEGVARLGYGDAESRRCLAQASVRVLDADFTCYDGRRKCAGEQWDEVLLVAKAQCPFRSAYVHELAHWLQQCVHGDYDPDHQETRLWAWVNSCPLECEQSSRAGP
ncbi:MAG: hypothetical protein QM765_37320 [Myxococcales bacterium]